MNIALLGSARAASSNLNGLAELLRQAVVEVRSGDTGSGTGIIWGGAGLVVTNAHCIKRGTQLQVDSAGKWREAHALAYHPQHDLALLAAPSVSGPLLELRDPESLRTGELVFAHGHPLGIRDALAMGVLHAVTRDRSKTQPGAMPYWACLRCAKDTLCLSLIGNFTEPRAMRIFCRQFI